MPKSTVGHIGAAEFAHGAQGDVILDAQSHCGVVKCFDSVVDGRPQVGMLAGSGIVAVHLVAMGIETADGTEKYLAFESERVAQANDFGHLFELIAESGSRTEWKG